MRTQYSRENRVSIVAFTLCVRVVFSLFLSLFFFFYTPPSSPFCAAVKYGGRFAAVYCATLAALARSSLPQPSVRSPPRVFGLQFFPPLFTHPKPFLPHDRLASITHRGASFSASRNMIHCSSSRVHAHTLLRTHSIAAAPQWHKTRFWLPKSQFFKHSLIC